MKINKIKITKNNFLVNDKISVPNDEKNSDYQAIQKWIENGGQVDTSELLSEAKIIKKQKINAQREKNKNSNILYRIKNEDHYFQRDIVSQLAFINAIVSEDDEVCNWITAQNQIVRLTKSDLIAICLHIKQRDDMEFYQARKRKDVVDAIESVEQLEEYDITTIYE